MTFGTTGVALFMESKKTGVDSLLGANTCEKASKPTPRKVSQTRLIATRALILRLEENNFTHALFAKVRLYRFEKAERLLKVIKRIKILSMS
ncbi:hypothetical protein [Runella rosea]|uniref:hypothetical protein n=1 Tax=Runella rosea TaxID=2259595 RepID=UPI001E4C4DF9|nr:hypothetical protein [Runella rosea]